MNYPARYAPTKWSRTAAKRLRPFVRFGWMRRLDARNRDAVEPVVEAAGPVVSMTTFEPRIERAYYALESVGAGSLRPSRLLLWVTTDALRRGVPPTLRRLERRGLEILTCEDYGPHKKHFPAARLLPDGAALVTADDDALYPTDWLSRLTAAAAARPGCVTAHRARTIVFRSDGALAPYATWPARRSDAPSPLAFSVGIGGAFLPPSMLRALRTAGDAFMSVCPRADDVWLKAVALRAGLDVRQAADCEPFLIDVPGMRRSGLARTNVRDGGNDAQIRATWTAQEIAFLRGAAADG